MKTKLVRIGNSRGVRIPRPLIEQAGLEDDVELQVSGSRIVIEAVRQPRAGWAEAAQRLQQRGDAGLLDDLTATDFDEAEWSWE